MNRRTLMKFATIGGALPWLVNACTGRDLTAYGARYLAGNYAPVPEETTATDLAVTGSLPEELTGRYLRNGPNPIGEQDPADYHWFRGSGMVHGVRLDEGRATWYRNRWIRSADVAEALGEPVTDELPPFGPNTHVIGYADSTWALVEAGQPPVELDDELETIGVNSFNDTLPGGFTAHPKLDPDTGELHAMCYQYPARRESARYVCVSPDGEVTRTLDVPVAGMTMMHDMSLTERYIVIYDQPVTVQLKMLVTRPTFPFAWDDDYGNRVGLLPRNGGVEDIVWIEVTPGYVFHPMNAYDDEDGNVVIDVCRYERMFDQDLNGPFGDSTPTLDRWVLNPTTRTAHETRIDETEQEFPRTNPSLIGKPYRYGYVAGADGTSFPAIYKHDLQTGSRQTIGMGDGRHTGEPYFIPRDGATAEDDGYLMTFVYDSNADASELVVFDAQDVAAPPIARVHLPTRVPYGFHGSWVPDGGIGV